MKSGDGSSEREERGDPTEAEPSTEADGREAPTRASVGAVSAGVREAVPPGRHGVFEIDDTGRCLFVSEGVAEIVGAPASEIIGESVFSGLFGTDATAVRSAFEAAIHGRRADTPMGDVLIQTRSGDPRWVRATTRFYRGADGETRVIGSLYDVTGQHEIERILERQLTYESRIGQLSLRLVESEVGAIDQVIREGLAEVAELAEVDRAFFFEVGAGQEGDVGVYSWTREGFEASTPGIDSGSLGDYAWYLPRMLEGELLRLGSVDDLPDEAGGEAGRMRRRGVRAALGVPVRSDARLLGYLSFECLREERDWSDWEVESLRLAAGVLAGATRRRRAERALAQQLAAERRIAELARRFVQLGTGEFDLGIAEGLRAAAELADADRCYLLGGLEGPGAPLRYEWHAPGVEPFTGEPEQGAVSDLGWATDQIRKNHLIHIPDPRKLPDVAAMERRDLVARGVRSMLGLALCAGPRIVGLIAFERLHEPKRWSEEELTRLTLMAELLGNAFQRKQAEDEAEGSRKGLLQAQKMEAVGRMAGGIAHDFNNLLTVILGNGRLLLQSFSEGDERVEEAEEITGAAERAAALTRQLLAFSRPQLASVRPVDLNRILRELERMLTRLVGEDIEMEIALADGPTVVMADPAQLEQVIVNLVVNARAALQAGGSIHLSTEVRDADPRRKAPLGPSIVGEAVVLTVMDSGCGMDEATRARIFEPFFTTREPGRGSGLGLSIVYGVIQRCGGLVDVQTASDEGTTFEIQLPRSYAPDARSAPERSVPVRASGTVLLVEDEESVRRLTRRTLERAGLRVLEARDGEHGLEVAAAHAGQIDLLLTDVVMPRMGGRKLARQLAESLPRLPVLFMSGYPSDRDALDGEPGLPTNLIQKPFTAPELLERVAELVNPPAGIDDEPSADSS